jgi:asparagine synthase (glutamine-hydrolysing)
MCGFVGFLNDTSDIELNKQSVRQMADKITHRGPDDDNYYVDEGVSIGFRRLSIIDLQGGAQPIFNEDGTMVLVFNGEIYNYQTIRTELIERGHIFKTKSDSEVLLHGYEEYGTKLFDKLRGMFAFVIWDKRTNTLFGARDIFGIKPFFYYKNGDTFLFASEIKAFLPHPSFKKEFNKERLPEYLCFEYIPSEQTMFKNVFKLPPASYFILRDGKLEINSYFEMKYDIDDSKSIEYFENLIAETFSGSVDAHGVSDVEVGCFLSGGVDSSYVVAEVAKRNNSVKTFSVGFAEEQYSELPFAEEFAKTVGVANYAKKITADEYFDIAPTVQYYMDEPLPNPSALPLFFLARCAAEHVKVVLSGEGADELFGGYHYYVEPLDFENYRKIPKPIRKAAALAARALPRSVHGRRFLVRGAQDIEERYIRNNYVFDYIEREHVLKHKSNAPNPAAFTKPYFDKAKGLDDITKMQYADIRVWMVHDILVKADRMSMASSLELRVPFLDKEVLKVALSIPSKYRVSKDNTKIVLRRAAARQLPEKTSGMRKKGFATPLNDWLRQDKFYNRVKASFESDIAREFFDVDYIMKLLNDHKAGRAKNMKKIWTIYSFIIWYEQYFVKN